MSKYNKKTYVSHLVISFLIGFLFFVLSYSFYSKFGFIFEFGSLISKSLSFISAVLVGWLIKRYSDCQDKIRDLVLDKNAPALIVQQFDGQREDFFKITDKSLTNIAFVILAGALVLICIVMPLESIKKYLGAVWYIYADTGFTITTLVFVGFVGYEVLKNTERSRKMKKHLDSIVAREVDRQNLIGTLSAKLREQKTKDVSLKGVRRENKDFDLRSCIDQLEKDKFSESEGESEDKGEGPQ